MLKNIIRTVAESLGYSVHRIARPPAAPSPPLSCVPLQPVRVELFPNWPVELTLSDTIQRHALVAGVNYEAPSPQLLRTFCSPAGSVFFDLGANFGYYSYYLLSQCPQLTVHSFEPNPTHLRGQRTAAAELAADRYFPHQIGLADRDGELTLTTSSIDTGWSTFGPNPAFKGIEETLTLQRVPVTSFDAWCQRENLALPSTPLWVAKIDVEGFEPKVLRGMSAALNGHAFKAVLVEVLDHTLNFCNETAEDVFVLMDRSGYTPFDIWLQPTVRQAREARNVLFLPKA
ncbi:MAG: hypothetical protein RL077_3364 [Verrucomicrobiota bacterium]|jgi:FkbM family methyltransferase